MSTESLQNAAIEVPGRSIPLKRFVVEVLAAAEITVVFALGSTALIKCCSVVPLMRGPGAGRVLKGPAQPHRAHPAPWWENDHEYSERALDAGWAFLGIGCARAGWFAADRTEPPSACASCAELQRALSLLGDDRLCRFQPSQS